MTGVEQMVVWLAGIVCGSAAVRSAVRSWSAARVEVAKVHAAGHVDGYRVVAQAGHLTVPADWMSDGGL